MSSTTATRLTAPAARGPAYARRYWRSPSAAAIVLLVILFPWVFIDLHVAARLEGDGRHTFVGLANYAKNAAGRAFPVGDHPDDLVHGGNDDSAMVLGVGPRCASPRNSKLRGLARTLFVLADDGDAGGNCAGFDDDVPSATWGIELPADLGGLPPSELGLQQQHVIPTLIMVETWQWTPLVMLIVLGGIASFAAGAV